MKNFIARIKGDNTRISTHGKSLQVYATDVDYGIIVVTPTNPQFSSIIVDKYLLLCEYGSVTPIIILNKSDLLENNPSILDYYEKALGIYVLHTSAITGAGIDTFKDKIAGKRSVLLGKSGVGKSSLINAMGANLNLEVGDVSSKYGEGKHTTTTTIEHKLDDVTTLIDTPGIRNLDVSNIEPLVLKELYPDFVKYSKDCKFSDCIHNKENICGVKKAVEVGEIPQDRYDNYLNIGKFN